jgi:CheY-like chemotaxis protein
MKVRGPDILLVDDDPNDVELTLHALRVAKLVNSIQIARDGHEALQFLLRTGEYAGRLDGDPKVILLDLKMPKIDGLGVLQRIRKEPGLRTLPVVMLTSSREERDIIASYNLGANSYIVKPVDFAQFSDAVRSAGLYWLLLNQPPVVDTEGTT